MKLNLAIGMAVLAFSGAAMAVTYPDSITTALTFSPSDDDPGTSYATIAIRELNANQTFTDTITFHVDVVSDVSFNVVSAPLFSTKAALQKEAQFDLLTVSGPQDFLGSGTIAADYLSAGFGFESLAVGDYTVTLLGHSVGKAGGNYYGNASITASVPEPESMALTLAGICVLAARGRRRKTA